MAIPSVEIACKGYTSGARVIYTYSPRESMPLLTFSTFNYWMQTVIFDCCLDGCVWLFIGDRGYYKAPPETGLMADYLGHVTIHSPSE